jgi:hypothetical protein
VAQLERIIADTDVGMLVRELFARSSLVERILALARDPEHPPLPGPDRDHLLQLLN